MDVYLGASFSSYYEQFPVVLVDVGASSGIERRWKPAERHLQVIGFEPDARAFAELELSQNPSSTKYLNTALWNTRVQLDYYLTRKQETSSIFRPNRAFLDRFPEAERFDILEVAQIEADSLDSQLSKHVIGDVDFIKLDAQGSELFILQGADGTVNDSVFGLEIEVEFAPMYENQPLFSEVDSFVRDHGFQLFDLRPHYWKRAVGMNCSGPKGQLIFADSLYLRDPTNFARMLDSSKDERWKKSKALRALSICILYGYRDYALEILDTTSGLFDESERQLISDKMKGDAVQPSRIPDFRGRGRIARGLYKLWMVLQPNYARHQGWATSADNLGNLE